MRISIIILLTLSTCSAFPMHLTKYPRFLFHHASKSIPSYKKNGRDRYVEVECERNLFIDLAIQASKANLNKQPFDELISRVKKYEIEHPNIRLTYVDTLYRLLCYIPWNGITIHNSINKQTRYPVLVNNKEIELQFWGKLVPTLRESDSFKLGAAIGEGEIKITELISENHTLDKQSEDIFNQLEYDNKYSGEKPQAHLTPRNLRFFGKQYQNCAQEAQSQQMEDLEQAKQEETEKKRQILDQDKEDFIYYIKLEARDGMNSEPSPIMYTNELMGYQRLLYHEKTPSRTCYEICDKYKKVVGHLFQKNSYNAYSSQPYVLSADWLTCAHAAEIIKAWQPNLKIDWRLDFLAEILQIDLD